MKRRFALLLVFLMSISLMCVAPAAAASASVVVFNDKKVDLSMSGPLRTYYDTYYLPLQFYKGYIPAISSSYDGFSNTLLIYYEGEIKLSFNLDSNTCSTGYSTTYQNIRVVYDGESGTFYLPVEFTVSQLGYAYSLLAGAQIIRIRGSGAALSDSEIVSKYSVPQQEETETSTVEEPDPSTKTVYLTFDDGPCNGTLKVLKKLDEYGFKATFFFVGRYMKAYPSVVRSVLVAGHSIGLHTVSHDYSAIYSSPEALLAEITECNNILQRITNTRTLLFRAPGGSEKGLSKAFADIVVENGYRIWDWNIDSGDSSSAGYTSEQIASQVIDTLSKRPAGSVSVILFHDTKSASIDALDAIFSYLKENGFRVLPITETVTAVNHLKGSKYK